MQKLPIDFCRRLIISFVYSILKNAKTNKNNAEKYSKALSQLQLIS